MRKLFCQSKGSFVVFGKRRKRKEYCQSCFLVSRLATTSYRSLLLLVPCRPLLNSSGTLDVLPSFHRLIVVPMYLHKHYQLFFCSYFFFTFSSSHIPESPIFSRELRKILIEKLYQRIYDDARWKILYCYSMKCNFFLNTVRFIFYIY